MPRRIASVALVSLVALAWAAPAQAQVPPGEGLVDFGQAECQDVGTISIVGPRAPNAPIGWTTTSGQELIAQSISGTFTDPEGNEFSFSKTYGSKTAFDFFTCIQTFDDPGEGSGTITISVAFVPPGS